jgi:hypothetical protein
MNFLLEEIVYSLDSDSAYISSPPCLSVWLQAMVQFDKNMQEKRQARVNTNKSSSARDLYMIRLHLSLESIAISGMLIDKEMANLISQGLKSNVTMRFEHVNCRFNGKLELQIILQSLLSNHSLKEIRLENTNISKISIDQIIESLKRPGLDILNTRMLEF